MPHRINAYSIVVPVFNNFDVSKECVERVLKNCPDDIQIIVIDDASTSGNFESFFSGLDQRIRFIRNHENLGFVKSANLGFEASGTDDVILVNSDVFVVSNWSERLQADAYRSDLIATVTAMTDRGSIATVIKGDRNLIGCTVSEIEEISEHLSSLPLLPPATIPVGVGHCLYVKRMALNVVGNFSEEFSPGYGEEVDFCMRAVQAGFIHTLSNSVIVKHLEGASFGGSRDDLKLEHEQLLNNKYPKYAEYVSTFEFHNDVQQTLFLRAITHKYGIRVLIDGRRITKAQTGTAIVTFELAKYLSGSQDFLGSVKVLMNDENLDIRGLNDQVAQITTKQLNAEIKKSGKFDVFFTPSQVDYMDYFRDANSWASRSVIVQLDFIAFDNPFYHTSILNFRNYQKFAILAGQSVDRILYNSEFVAVEAIRVLQSNCEIESREYVVGAGLDHVSEPARSAAKAKPIPQLGIIGTNFHHKNRLFGLEVIRNLQKEFPGAKLHLIGISPTWGSSVVDEDMWLAENPELRELVVDHGGVNEAKKAAIIESLDLLLVPSVTEGFGLAPFDGLPLGVPSIFPRLHSTFEVLPDPPFYLSFVDPEHTHNSIVGLLTDHNAREQQFKYLKSIKDNFTWNSVSDQVAKALQEVVIELPKLSRATIPSEIKVTNEFNLGDASLNFRKVFQAMGQTGFFLKTIPVNSRRRKLINKLLAPLGIPAFIRIFLTKRRSRLAFDNSYYAVQLAEQKLPIDLGYEHFADIGWRMGLNPNKWFNTIYYLENNEDVELLGKNPLEHFYRFGRKEGRLPSEQALIEFESKMDLASK